MERLRSRPNILWIYCDELRADALGCYSDEWYRLTPNIDGLAETGTLFENFFTNSPVCVPARVGMHTGRLPEETGVFGNEADLPGYQYHGPPSFLEAVKQHGYRCINVGKEHLPKVMKPWSEDLARGSSMRDMLANLSIEQLRGIVTPGSRQIIAARYPKGYMCPGAEVTNQVCKLLQSLTEPFVLRASFLQPHTPVIAEDEFMAKAESCSWLARLEENDDRPRTISAFERRFAEVSGGMELTAAEVRTARQAYAAVVSWLDKQVAEILVGLEESGARDRTAVVITADHGANLGESGAFGKHTFAPQCQRIPFLISWPAEIARGVKNADLCQGIDLPRTLCELLEVKPPAWAAGRSVISGLPPDHIFGSIGYGGRESRAFPTLGVGQYWDGHGWPRRACIRSKRLRLDANVLLDGREAKSAERDVFLADMSIDKDELTDVSEDPSYAEERRALEELLIKQSRSGDNLAIEDAYIAVKGAQASLSKTRAEIMW